MSKFAHHFHVIGYTLVQSFCFVGLANLLKIFHALRKVILNLMNGVQGALFCSHEKVGWVYFVFIKVDDAAPCVGINLFYALNVIVPECHAQHMVAVGEADVHRVALHAEHSSVQFKVVAHVEAAHKFAQKNISVELHSHLYL